MTRKVRKNTRTTSSKRTRKNFKTDRFSRTDN